MHDQLESINLEDLLRNKKPRENFNIIKLDEGKYAVRVAKIHGRFPWHSHPHGDEGWLVWDGHMSITTEGGDIELKKGDFTVIPNGLLHSPIAHIDNTIVVIFNLTQLGMNLMNKDVDLGGFELPTESQS
ncbi:cupin domain-containing protein [Natribacillus halophilus]|uniref:Cupin domain-containing protein n=1 Tax=Natribacillus halophilus TaxID=549003 RepID=A0A1G8RE79_9BACI|nr:cupin domain-containing protein [Natribacillus halophilus]SDJ14680.1 Cupin domain-containing protein [Natribacillus halophilus]